MNISQQKGTNIKAAFLIFFLFLVVSSSEIQTFSLSCSSSENQPRCVSEGVFADCSFKSKTLGKGRWAAHTQGSEVSADLQSVPLDVS